jgi:hypothetical protein
MAKERCASVTRKELFLFQLGMNIINMESIKIYGGKWNLFEASKHVPSKSFYNGSKNVVEISLQQGFVYIEQKTLTFPHQQWSVRVPSPCQALNRCWQSQCNGAEGRQDSIESFVVNVIIVEVLIF